MALSRPAAPSDTPWADVSNNRVRVRLRDDDEGGLPEKGELPNLWRHSYFIDSLRTMAVALLDGAREGP